MPDEGGVWRTISGRRVFIRNGQSLSDAMEESGKFGGDKGGRSRSGKDGGEKQSAGSERIEAPPLNKTWIQRFEQGKKLAEVYPDSSFADAVQTAVYDRPELIADYLSDAEDWGPKTCFMREQFFKAGFYDDTPEYVQAIRFGDIPDSGRSTNWATGDLEQGVSVVKIVRAGDSFSDKSIYDITQGMQDIPKYEVRGWFLGRTGSDGEPLLVEAEVVREIKPKGNK